MARRGKSWGETAGDWLSDRAVRLLIGAALRLPYAQRLALVGWAMRRVVAPLAGYRGRALANLAHVFPQMPLAERRRIAAGVAENVGRTLIENYSGTEFTGRMAQLPLQGPGVAALEAARAAGQPVILVTGHFGNYEAGRAALVARGYEIGGLYRPMKNSYFNAHYVKTMESFGGPVFAQGRRGTAGFVRHLRAGGMLVLLFDQHVRKEPVLDFLGQPARTPTSSADLARRYGALLLPFYATRGEDGLSFTVELEAPVPHGPPEDMMQALNDGLAARVRARPEQWFWFHNRWKGAGDGPGKKKPKTPRT